jgi:hypothetical protein
MKVLQRRFSVQDLKNLFQADFINGILYCKKTGRAILNKPNKDGYLRVGIKDGKNGKYKPYYIHDIIFYMKYAWLPEEIDHINHIKNDNRDVNLQPSNHNLQQVNMPKKSGTSSRYKGVCYAPHKRINKWRAQLQHRGKHISLGHYDTEEQAARAYDKAAYAIWGEYSRPHLNFPNDINNNMVQLLLNLELA